MRLALDARKLTDYGIGTYVRHLVAGLGARDDLELTLLARPGQEDSLRELAAGARLFTVSAAGYSLAEQASVPLTLWRARPELVHVPHYVLPPLLPCPAVVTVHDVIQLFYPPERRRTIAVAYLRTILRGALKRARRVITVSRTSRRDLVNLFGADRDRLVVVPNGVEDALGRRPEADVLEDVKRTYDLRPPLVLVVANDKPHKNLDAVLRAFHVAVLHHRLPGQLVFVGGPESDSRLAHRAARLGLTERVRCLGRVPFGHLHALYHVAAVLLHVALYEGFGLPVLEAMRAGLPVVTSNLGAMREVGEGAARLVNPLDVTEIAAALAQVLVDDPLRRRMVEAGRRRAETLTWQRAVEATVDVYRQAVGEATR